MKHPVIGGRRRNLSESDSRIECLEASSISVTHSRVYLRGLTPDAAFITLLNHRHGNMSSALGVVPSDSPALVQLPQHTFYLLCYVHTDLDVFPLQTSSAEIGSPSFLYRHVIRLDMWYPCSKKQNVVQLIHCGGSHRPQGLPHTPKNLSFHALQKRFHLAGISPDLTSAISANSLITKLGPTPNYNTALSQLPCWVFADLLIFQHYIQIHWSGKYKPPCTPIFKSAPGTQNIILKICWNQVADDPPFIA